MASFEGKHKRFVVRRLAVFDRPSEVRDALQDRFGIEASLSQIVHYDPTNERGRRLAGDLEELFHETRTAFVEEQKGIALAHKSKRLRELEKQYYRLLGRLESLPEGDTESRVQIEAEMREVLEQMAKETGGKYTRKQLLELMGEDGGPVQTEQASVQIFVPDNGRGGAQGPETSAHNDHG